MIRKKYHLQIIIRVILITLNSLLITIAVYNLRKDYLFVTFNLTLLLISQLWFLLRYINRSNRDISNFFFSILNDDYSPTYASQQSKNQIFEYQLILEKINEIIKNKSLEVEKQKQYLENTFQKTLVGIISFDESNKVDLYNLQAQELLGTNKISTLDDLSIVYPDFTETIRKMPLEKTLIHKAIIPSCHHPDIKETRIFAINKSIFTLDDKKIHLISFSNIKNELENQELDSWQKLIRVLTHEIMNSVSPIPALTDNIHKTYIDQDTNNYKEISRLTEKDISVTLKGLKTIEQSSHNLLNFVKQYRSLTLLAQPNLSVFSLESVLANIQNLFENELKTKNINFITELHPKNIEIHADRTMMDQVFINLTKNAIVALEKSKKKTISIQANQNNQKRVHIQFSDTGSGFSEEIAEKIFIPFFSTKDNGSGIGLSLSRQIIRLHSGEINAYSTPGKGTKFVIQL